MITARLIRPPRWLNPAKPRNAAVLRRLRSCLPRVSTADETLDEIPRALLSGRAAPKCCRTAPNWGSDWGLRRMRVALAWAIFGVVNRHSEETS
jgi:hypothetical protein